MSNFFPCSYLDPERSISAQPHFMMPKEGKHGPEKGFQLTVRKAVLMFVCKEATGYSHAKQYFKTRPAHNKILTQQEFDELIKYLDTKMIRRDE